MPAPSRVPVLQRPVPAGACVSDVQLTDVINSLSAVFDLLMVPSSQKNIANSAVHETFPLRT